MHQPQPIALGSVDADTQDGRNLLREDTIHSSDEDFLFPMRELAVRLRGCCVRVAFG